MACSPPEMPVPAIAAAPATARSRFLGLAPDMTAARPTAAAGVVLSIVVIHLGICACSSPCGRERNWRAATSSSKTPRTILIQLTQAAGGPDLLAPGGPGRGQHDGPDDAQAEQPACDEGRAVDLGPVAGEHEHYGDDRDRAECDADCQWQRSPDGLAHRSSFKVPGRPRRRPSPDSERSALLRAYLPWPIAGSCRPWWRARALGPRVRGGRRVPR